MFWGVATHSISGETVCVVNFDSVQQWLLYFVCICFEVPYLKQKIIHD